MLAWTKIHSTTNEVKRIKILAKRWIPTFTRIHTARPLYWNKREVNGNVLKWVNSQ